MQQQDKELFHNYEIKTWNFSPRLYKILGAAIAFNLLTILVLGQTNLLTRKGCESPIVGTICQVIDTVTVGSNLLGTDSEFVSKDYDKNQIEDADVTFIDVSGKEPPLQYPEGYFALANPENQLATMENPINGFSNFPNTISGLPNGLTTTPSVNDGTSLLTQPQVTPTPNKNPIIGGFPDDSSISLAPNPVPPPPMKNGIKPSRTYPPRPSKIKRNPPIDLTDFDKQTTAENNDKTKDKEVDKNAKPLESAALKEVEINKKPFEDLGDLINGKVAKKEIDLSKPFLVVMDGAITKDGKLDTDPKKSRYIKAEGDEQMVNVAKEVIEAVGNSGFLGYLKNNGVDRVNFTMVQDDKQIYIKIISDQKTPEKAGTTASGFNTLLAGLKFADANGFKKLDDNSKTLLTNSKVTSDGKNFILDFVIPKQDAQDIINRELRKQAEKKAAQQQPNSSADLGKNANANVVK